VDIPVHGHDGQREHGRSEGEISTALNLPGKPYALFRRLALIGYYATPGEAFAAGMAEFPDGGFSIQEIGRGGFGPGSVPTSFS
jgi:hypothetical protein